MSWSSSRRTFIILLLGSALVLVAAGFLVATFYNPPSCNDNKQNQDEEGIDCGGSICTTLCTPSVVAPVVSFVRELPQASGRIDVIAYIKNPNAFAAAKNVAYQIEFVGENGTPIGSVNGKLDLPPAMSVPIYVPNALTTGQFARQSFLTFDDASFRWYAAKEGELVIFSVDEIQTVGTEEAPKVTATLSNPSTKAFKNVKVVATVFDAAGNAMAASQTLAATLPALGEAPLVFTWNTPFREAPARIDIKPVYVLP